MSSSPFIHGAQNDVAEQSKTAENPETASSGGDAETTVELNSARNSGGEIHPERDTVDGNSTNAQNAGGTSSTQPGRGHSFDIPASEPDTLLHESCTVPLSLRPDTHSTEYFTAHSNGTSPNRLQSRLSALTGSQTSLTAENSEPGSPRVAESIAASPETEKKSLRKILDAVRAFFCCPSMENPSLSPRDTALKEGDVFDKYVIEATLQNEGNRRHAIHCVSRRRVTLEFFEDPALMECVRARHQALHSDNVCRLVDCVKADFPLCYCLVFERGGYTLEEWMRGPERSSLDRVAACNEILLALRDLHQAGIVHGELTPSNVQWFETNSGGAWKLAGTGCLPHNSSFEQRDRVCRHASPEGHQAIEGGHRGQTDPASDMWSFGLLAYECLTGSTSLDAAHVLSMSMFFAGRQLYDGEGSSSNFMSGLQLDTIVEKLEHVKDVTERDLLRRLLCVDSAKPPTAAEALRHDLFRSPPDRCPNFVSGEMDVLWRILRVEEARLQEARLATLQLSISVEYFKTHSDAYYPLHLRRTRKAFTVTDSYLPNEPIFVLRAEENCRVHITITRVQLLPLPIRQIMGVRVRLGDQDNVPLVMQSVVQTETVHDIVALLEPLKFMSRSMVVESRLFGRIDVKYLKLDVIIRVLMEGDGGQELELPRTIYCKIVRKNSRMWFYQLMNKVKEFWECLPDNMREAAKASVAVVPMVIGRVVLYGADE